MPLAHLWQRHRSGAAKSRRQSGSCTSAGFFESRLLDLQVQDSSNFKRRFRKERNIKCRIRAYRVFLAPDLAVLHG